MITPECSANCAKVAYCAVCGRRKAPVGRDTMGNGLCLSDCEGYRDPPVPGHLWPDEWPPVAAEDE